MVTFLSLFLFVPLAQSIPQQFELSPCQQGSEIWCSNQETASMCQVLDFCKTERLGAFANRPVQIELYYEALCPDCQQFMKEQLYPAFQKLYKTGIFELSLIPYGNADERKVGEKWIFQCQHGERECQMNLIETCAIHLLNHPTQFMPFIHCIESNPTLENAQKCADSLAIKWAPISACYNGSEGNFLEHQMAQRTDALKPQHQYVPWIVVDGVHTEEIQNKAEQNLIGFICQQYKGQRPSECDAFLMENKRCYKGEITA